MVWVRAWSDDDVSKHVDNLHLAVANKHPRDAVVAFREEDHVYFVKVVDTWLKLKTSVSGVYSRFFEHFDDRNAAASVARKRKNDRNSPYYWLIQSCSDAHDEDAVAPVGAAARDRGPVATTRLHAFLVVVDHREHQLRLRQPAAHRGVLRPVEQRLALLVGIAQLEQLRCCWDGGGRSASTLVEEEALRRRQKLLVLSRHHGRCHVVHAARQVDPWLEQDRVEHGLQRRAAKRVRRPEPRSAIRCCVQLCARPALTLPLW